MEEFAAQRRRALGVAQLLEQVSRRVLERRSADDLHAAQWSALRYFSRAGRRAANVAGLAKYLGNTTGPASRTVKSLIERGYLVSAPSPHDARSVVISLTEAGIETLAQDPLHAISSEIEPFSDEKISLLAECLSELHEVLSKQRNSE